MTVLRSAIMLIDIYLSTCILAAFVESYLVFVCSNFEKTFLFVVKTESETDNVICFHQAKTSS